MRSLSKQQKRMIAIVKSFKKYVNTYTNQEGYSSYSDATFILDMLYGIGIAIDKKKYCMADGFQDFKERFARYLNTRKLEL